MFTREDGQPYHPDYGSKAFHRLVGRAGLPPMKLHGLRHFRAAALISTAADIAAVSKMMGHSSISITSDLYGSPFEKANQAVSEAAVALDPRRRPA